MRDELLLYYERELTYLRHMEPSLRTSIPRSHPGWSSSRTSARIRMSSGCSKRSRFSRPVST